jgi:hypothetical protein
MAAKIIKCRKGDPCSFNVHVTTGLSTDYTRAKFQVRDAWDEEAAALIAVDESAGIAFDYDNDIITVSIGATLTDSLPVLNKAREVAAQLRLYNAADTNDRISWPIPFMLLPEVIVDG